MAEKSIVTKQRFKISIDGLQDENFTSFSDIVYTANPIEEKGGADPFAKTHQGKGKYEPITLTRSFNPGDLFFENWKKEGKSKNVSIIYQDSEGQDASRFNLQNAKVNSRTVSGGDSSADAMSTETVTLVFESGEWAK